MTTRLLYVGLALGLFATCAWAAKPADLPLDPGGRCAPNSAAPDYQLMVVDAAESSVDCEEETEESQMCPCLDTFCATLCELACYFQQIGSVSQPGSERLNMAPKQVLSEPKTPDRPEEPMSAEEMQEMLDSAMFLESELEEPYFGPDELLPEKVLARPRP